MQNEGFLPIQSTNIGIAKTSTGFWNFVVAEGVCET